MGEMFDLFSIYVTSLLMELKLKSANSGEKPGLKVVDVD